MATIKELNNVFDQAEELVGTYPSAAGLRNAIHAVITKRIDIYDLHRLTRSTHVLDNIEELARNYETLRGTHMHWGTSCLETCDTPTE